MTTRSDSIGALAAALAKAQAEIEGAAKDKTNPHYKNQYADLASVWNACRAPLTKNGLAVVQTVSADGATVFVGTMLMHASGEWVADTLSMTAATPTPQGLGSCVTYARRYALAAMVGVAPEDDDGQAASHPPALVGARPAAAGMARPREVAPPQFAEWLKDLTKVADHGTAALTKAWRDSPDVNRKHLIATDTAGWEALKKRAEQVPVPS